MAKRDWTRRQAFFGLGSALLVGCGGGGRAKRRYDASTVFRAAEAEEAKECALTADNIEGPFFTEDAPSRAVLAGPNTKGKALAVTGRVLDTDCKPIAKAVLEVWQADHNGAYDNSGFRFRGTMTANAKGAYELQSIVPGRYLNGRQYRPAHIHVKVHASGFRSLTTQLYFEGDPYNDVDPFIDTSLIMKLTKRDRGVAASFDFVLDRASR
jgi:protocatechuate 3,4-dioxygenase beta subunit